MRKNFTIFTGTRDRGIEGIDIEMTMAMVMIMMMTMKRKRKKMKEGKERSDVFKSFRTRYSLSCPCASPIHVSRYVVAEREKERRGA